MKKILTLLLLILPAIHALAQETGAFPGIERLMEPDEYKAAGLDKLNAQERSALNQWLIKYTAFEAPIIRQTNEEVKKVEKEFEITAHIKQPFEGWSGKSAFYLDNGEVWKQRQGGKYRYTGNDTAVRIDKNFLGFHVMTLITTGKTVGVKRIK